MYDRRAKQSGTYHNIFLALRNMVAGLSLRGLHSLPLVGRVCIFGRVVRNGSLPVFHDNQRAPHRAVGGSGKAVQPSGVGGIRAKQKEKRKEHERATARESEERSEACGRGQGDADSRARSSRECVRGGR